MKLQNLHVALGASTIACGLAAAQTPTQLQWLNADPGYVTNTTIPSIAGAPFIATGDVDRDGDVDALCGLTYVENGLVLGTTPKYGQFTANGSCAVDPFLSNLIAGTLADLNGDGFPELVAITGPLIGGGGSIGIWANVPGTCTTRRLVDARSVGWTYSLPTTGESALAVADFDGDGDRDVVIGGGSGGVRMLRNDAIAGGRSFLVAIASLGAASVTELAASDLDGDGDVDLAIGGGILTAGTQTIALNNGAGTFTASAGAIQSGVGFPLCITATNVDGDADVDLVYGYQTRSTLAAPNVWLEGGLRVYTNNGAGVFTPAQFAYGGTSVTGVAGGDVDEDGLLDLVACTRQEAVTGSSTSSGTRFLGRQTAAGPFVDQTLAGGGAPGRIGDATATGGCFDPANPIVDAIDPSSCLALDATGIALVDLDLDLDLDVVVSYRLQVGFGVFSNLLWHLEAPRTVSAVQDPTTQLWTWTVPYDHYCEFNVPNFGPSAGWSIVGVSLTPPVHVFPATANGVVTTAPYVTGPFTVFAGQGRFDMVLGPFDTATKNSFIGTHLFATSVVGSFTRNIYRISSVVDTVVQ